MASSSSSSSTASYDDREWTSLNAVDYSILVFVGAWQAFSVVVCLHLFLNRHWPPYVTKNAALVIVTGLSGALWSASMTLAWGYWDRQPGDLIAHCELEVFLTWSSLCLHAAAFMVRPYRMWKLLVKHDGNMWHTMYQILLTSSTWVIPTTAALASESSSYYNYNTNFCSTDGLSRGVAGLMNMIGLAGFVFLWCVCVRQLRGVRRQYNEYESLRWSLGAASLMLVTYPVLMNFLLADEPVVQRRLSLAYPIVTTYVLFWRAIREPFFKKLMCDEAYLLSYTKGFSSLPTPAQLRASFAEQLSVDQLREEFRRYIKGKVAQELIDFYQESLDREEVTDFFERQAVTMRIIDRFIRVGAKDEVNISQQCRERVLAMDATDYIIFEEARSEVLLVMETNFQQDFAESDGFRQLAEASEREARELSLLRAGGVAPDPRRLSRLPARGSNNSNIISGVNRGFMRHSTLVSGIRRSGSRDRGAVDFGVSIGTQDRRQNTNNRGRGAGADTNANINNNGSTGSSSSSSSNSNNNNSINNGVGVNSENDSSKTTPNTPNHPRSCSSEDNGSRSSSSRSIKDSNTKRSWRERPPPRPTRSEIRYKSRLAETATGNSSKCATRRSPSRTVAVDTTSPRQERTPSPVTSPRGGGHGTAHDGRGRRAEELPRSSSSGRGPLLASESGTVRHHDRLNTARGPGLAAFGKHHMRAAHGPPDAIGSRNRAGVTSDIEHV